jgi:hypothetical protein
MEGYSKGEVCNRDGCQGIIQEHEKEGFCSCHINPPCSYCVDSVAYCELCDWDGYEEQKDYIYPSTQSNFDFKVRTINDLDNSKIDWISESHTHFSMKKIGVFPKGTTPEEVAKEVRGTFGGRFSYFREDSQRFEYIAYTD